jgi:hypothetical protein
MHSNSQYEAIVASGSGSVSGSGSKVLGLVDTDTDTDADGFIFIFGIAAEPTRRNPREGTHEKVAFGEPERA